jgi:hypothetical protein
MITTPENGLQITYKAICDLGLELADSGHFWTNKQRKLWDTAEQTMRHILTSNVKLRGALPVENDKGN